MGAVDRIFSIIDLEEKIEPSIPKDVILNDELYKMMWLKDDKIRNKDYNRLLDVQDMDNKRTLIESGSIEFQNVKFN